MEIKRTFLQQLSRYLPFIGMGIGMIALGALLSGLAVFGVQGMNIWRISQFVVYAGFAIAFIIFEGSGNKNPVIATMIITLPIGFTVGYAIYLF